MLRCLGPEPQMGLPRSPRTLALPGFSISHSLPLRKGKVPVSVLSHARKCCVCFTAHTTCGSFSKSPCACPSEEKLLRIFPRSGRKLPDGWCLAIKCQVFQKTVLYLGKIFVFPTGNPSESVKLKDQEGSEPHGTPILDMAQYGGNASPGNLVCFPAVSFVFHIFGLALFVQILLYIRFSALERRRCRCWLPSPIQFGTRRAKLSDRQGIRDSVLYSQNICISNGCERPQIGINKI